jgi:hypothetical protein
VRYSFGDFYTDPTSLPNLVDWITRNTKIRARIVGHFLRLTDKDILKNPFLWITGHQHFSFCEEERRALRNYLFSGGFAFIDDCNWQIGNPFDVCMRAELRASLGAQVYNSLYKVPPGNKNFDKLLHIYYDFDQTPSGWDNYGGRPYNFVEAIDINDKVSVIYSNRDYGCGIEDPSVHGTYWPVVLKFITNCVIYQLTYSPLVNSKDYIRE